MSVERKADNNNSKEEQIPSWLYHSDDSYLTRYENSTPYRDGGSRGEGTRHEISGKSGPSWRFWKPWMTRGKNYWKPITLRAPVLGSFIAISILIVIILEMLSRIADVSLDFTGSGAVAYANTDGSLSNYSSFTFLYLPSIIAVCYSMLWSWVDLDSKRLEPWFQLSKESGALAEDSLMLHYNFDFLAVVPIRAARRRHWSVFFAGMTMLIVFWIITPLQSAIFGTGAVIRTRTSRMVTTAAIKPIETQTDTLNSNFLMTAYGISWLGEQLPEFTAESYAIRPFEPLTQDVVTSSTQTWSTSTSAYSTNITCEPAKITPHGDRQYDFDNGKGCFVPDIGLATSSGAGNYSYVLIYIGYFDDPNIDWSLGNPNCSLEFSNSFLAVWASSRSLTSNGTYEEMTALFCETSYTVRNITVQVNASDHSILSENFGSTEIQPLSEGIINTTNFEYIIGTGFSPLKQVTDYPNTLLVEQYPRIMEYNLTWPTTNMVGYGVAAASSSIDRLGDPILLQSAFRKAHQLLFSVAFNRLMDDSASRESQDLHDGQLQDHVNGIILVRVFSIIVEGFLVMTCFMTAGLWYIMSHRRSRLVRDPNSIGQYMGVVSDCHELKEVFRDMGTTTQEQLYTRLRVNTFRIRGMVEGDKPSMFLEVLPNEGRTDNRELPDETTFPKSESVVARTRPRELRYSTGVVFISILTLSVFALIYINNLMIKTNGLKLPSSSAVIRQILENYLPTVLATAIEPFWVVLNRLLCILKPFDELRRGNSPPAKSIDVKYTSLPPQLVFWRAIMSRHLLLAAVCAISVLANVLAVSLSGLFNEALTTNITEIVSTYKLSNTFNGASFNSFVGEFGYSDHLYITLANLSASTSLPPWTSRDFFFTPFDLDNKTSELTQFSAVTRGFGVDTLCDIITECSTRDRQVLSESDNATSAQISVLYDTPNGTLITCTPAATQYCVGDPLSFTLPVPGSGANAFEFVGGMFPFSQADNANVSDDQECDRLLVTGWARLGPSPTQDVYDLASDPTRNRSFDSIFLSCYPTLRTALFNVTVDGNGSILSTKQQTSFDTSLEPFFKGTAASDLTNPVKFAASQMEFLYTQTNSLINRGGSNSKWHNNTISNDWFNYLLTFATNSTSIISPNNPIPSPATLIPIVESLYNQIFATLLSLNQQVFNPADPSAVVTVTITTPTTRIFMSQTMFVTTLTILSLNLLVAILYYAYRPKCFLPMMPTTIASIVGLVVATRAVEDYSGEISSVHSRDLKSTAATTTALGEQNQIIRSSLRYGYGRFVGTDGTTRIGIERHPWVVPLEMKNPDAPRKRNMWSSTLGLRFGKKKDEKEISSWI